MVLERLSTILSDQVSNRMDDASPQVPSFASRITTLIYLQAITTSFIYLLQHLFLWILLPSEVRYYRGHPIGSKRRRSTSDLCVLSVKSILNTVLIVFVVLDVGRPETPFLVRIFEAISYVSPSEVAMPALSPLSVPCRTR